LGSRRSDRVKQASRQGIDDDDEETAAGKIHQRQQGPERHADGGPDGDGGQADEQRQANDGIQRRIAAGMRSSAGVSGMG
jgi:hypothetical protein